MLLDMNGILMLLYFIKSRMPLTLRYTIDLWAGKKRGNASKEIMTQSFIIQNFYFILIARVLFYLTVV